MTHLPLLLSILFVHVCLTIYIFILIGNKPIPHVVVHFILFVNLMLGLVHKNEKVSLSVLLREKRWGFFFILFLGSDLNVTTLTSKSTARVTREQDTYA